MVNMQPIIRQMQAAGATAHRAIAATLIDRGACTARWWGIILLHGTRWGARATRFPALIDPSVLSMSCQTEFAL